MANPRQRSKARSSSHKPVSQSRRAKKILKKTPPIRGPKALQDAWQKHKTVRQNYQALGLVHTLNPLASGGAECDPSKHEAPADLETDPSPVSAPSTIPHGHGKILRDEAGNVIGVELPEELDGVEDPKELDMEQLEPEIDRAVMREWVSELGGGKGHASGVVGALERIACASTSTSTMSIPIGSSGPRHSSGGEVAYLQRLITKYGADDLEGMSRDRKLNVEQRTVGELRRALKRSGLAR